MAKPSTLDELLFEAANPFEQLLATFTFEDDSVASKIKAITERSKVIKALMLQADKEGKTETSALKKFLTDKVRDHRATNSLEVKRVLDFVLNQKERSACLWLVDNPDQFAWVRKHSPDRLTAQTMQKAWGTFRDKSIKEQMAAAPKAEREKVVATLASDFFTTSEAVEARIEAFAEAAKKKAEKEQPVPTPDINPVMVLRDWLLEANEKELDAIQTLLDERKARLGVSPEPSDSKGLVRFLEQGMIERVRRNLITLESMTPRSELHSDIADLVEGDDLEGRKKSARALAKKFRDLIEGKPKDEAAAMAELISFVAKIRWGSGSGFPSEATEIATEEWCRKAIMKRINARRTYGKIGL